MKLLPLQLQLALRLEAAYQAHAWRAAAQQVARVIRDVEAGAHLTDSDREMASRELRLRPLRQLLEEFTTNADACVRLAQDP